MDEISRAAMAGELASELQTILDKLDRLEFYLTAAKISSALDALSEEACLPEIGDGIETPAIRSEKLTGSS